MCRRKYLDENQSRLRSDSRPRLSSRIHADEAAICTASARRFFPMKTKAFRTETQKYRMDAGDFSFPFREMHNFRVTRLCMRCTRLKNKNLQTHDFH
jgi:hypothetical protein